MESADRRTLDPLDWNDFRLQSHRMLNDILDYTEHLRDRPVWRQIPQSVRDRFHQPLPKQGSELASVHNRFMRDILPYSIGNTHPGFMGWVHGGGTPAGMLAEMLAAGLNANLGGRDQIPIEVERQVLQWVREIFGFPGTASGLFVTGTSMANFMAVVIARTAAAGIGVRSEGVGTSAKHFTAYTSAGAHGCISQAMDLAGLGSERLRIVPMNQRHQIDLEALEKTIQADKLEGCTPFLIVGSAGTVDVGAIDDLAAMADLACKETVWFHVDGALGALGMLSPDIAPRLAGIERADSIAFDFHKWGQVPYDAGFILVRDGALHESTFSSPAAYLSRGTRGMAAGSPWPCDFGPDLSRGFRALKTWFTIQVYGAEKLGEVISTTCKLAQYLKERINNESTLELLAPVELNIVCFRYISENADIVNENIVASLQESGMVAPSTTVVDGRLAIRAAIVNHRTSLCDVDALVSGVIALGAANVSSSLHNLQLMSDDRLIGLASLATLAFKGGDLRPLRTALLERAAGNDNDANALMDLSTVLQLTGNREIGLSVQGLALGIQQLYHLPYLGQRAVRLLVIVTPGDLSENNTVELLLDKSDVALDLLYVGADLPWPDSVPGHDLVMVAICESDRNRPVLNQVGNLLKSWPQPIICSPPRIARLSRDGACQLLQSRAGLVMPVTARIDRHTLECVGHSGLAISTLIPDGCFPIIARPVDSQKGHGLRKLDGEEEIFDYLKGRPEAEFNVARYVDSRGADGKFRKFRIVLIDGRPYACHMCISDHWIAHYAKCGMLESAEKRAEEAQFFAGFEAGFAVRHRDALNYVADRLELEYVGIDGAETADGALLIFEVDSGMTVHGMDPVELFPYKHVQMRKVFKAFRQMLLDKSQVRVSSSQMC